MRNFLRRFGDGGGQVAARHFSAGFAGASRLTNANADGVLSNAMGHNFEVSCWVWLDSLPAGTYQKIVHVGGGTTATDDYGLQINGTTLNIEAFSSNGTVYSTVSVPAFVPVVNQWYWVWASYGGFTNAIEIYIGGTVATTGGSTGSNGVQNLTEPLYVGRNPDNATGGLLGRVDSLGFWPTGTPAAISNGDFAALRNNGKAPEYRDLPSYVNLAAWYDFNEPTGSATWIDAVGGHSLTASGIVTRQKGAGY